MRLPIDIAGMTFMCAAPARPVTDFETKQQKADLATGELLYNLQVVALDEDGAQIITVRVAGDPKVGQGAMLKLDGLVATPGRWVIGRAWRFARIGWRRSALPVVPRGSRQRPRPHRLGGVRMRVTVAERRWRPAAQAQLEELLAGVGWAFWRWRVELVALAALAIAVEALGRPLGHDRRDDRRRRRCCGGAGVRPCAASGVRAVPPGACAARMGARRRRRRARGQSRGGSSRAVRHEDSNWRPAARAGRARSVGPGAGGATRGACRLLAGSRGSGASRAC